MENEKCKAVIALYCSDFHELVVGHVPINLSKVLFSFLQLPNSMHTFDVTRYSTEMQAMIWRFQSPILAQKRKLFFKVIFGKCDQIRSQFFDAKFEIEENLELPL